MSIINFMMGGIYGIMQIQRWSYFVENVMQKSMVSQISK